MSSVPRRHDATKKNPTGNTSTKPQVVSTDILRAATPKS